MVIRFLPAAAATAVVALVAVTLHLDGILRSIAIGALVAAWLMPLLFARRAVGAHGSVVAGIAAIVTAGQVRAGAPYGIACGLFLLCAVVSLRRARTTGPLPPPRLRGVLPLLVVGPAVTAGLVLGLPPLAARVERRMNDLFGRNAEDETAFSMRMHLGSTRGMLQRSDVVMRIDGPTPEYLRGAVYELYESSAWVTGRRGNATTSIEAVPGERPSRIVLARGTADGPDMRWFLPSGACDLLTANPSVAVDGFGIARRGTGDDPPTIRYRTTGCTPAPIAPPGPNDLDAPLGLQARLKAIGDAWTVGESTPRAKLDAIVRRLSAFEYSLDVPRNERVDPIIDFLTIHRAGHCEYFASALVLLARQQGIPARVVGGFHVGEVNPLTGMAVVRERNAHAWAEAWVDGAWRTWDATPAGGTPARTSTLDDIGDLLATEWSALVSLLARLGPLGVLAFGVAGVVVWFLVRVVLGAARRAWKTRARPNPERPLPCFERLTIALARAGLVREESEPLEAFASRLARRTDAWANAASAAVATYAALRYGGIGDGTAVEQQLDHVARTIE